MTLEQRARMAVLYDLYSGLLTEKQQEVSRHGAYPYSEGQSG